MYFAIIALIASLVQIVIGVGIGISMAKQRSRERSAGPSRLRVAPRPAASADQHVDDALSAGGQPTALASQGDETHRSGAISTFPENSRHRVVGDGSTPLADQRGGPGVAADNRSPIAANSNLRQIQPAEQAGASINTIPEIPRPPDVPSGRDRRVATRRAFDYRQFVAPYHGGALPGKASFREVECQDISSTGFSFLSSQLPDFDSLVVALGVMPHLMYVQAHIVNRFQIADGPAPLYRIGCRFSGQVN